MKKTLNAIGNTLVVLGFLFIGLCLISVAVDKGLYAVLKLLAPWNIANYFMMFLTILPGLLFKMWADKTE
jgi:hypothetical protein